jgi:hypothetical protein
MLSKCANPECTARFLYLHQGKVFKFATSKDPGDPCGPKIEYFWLCGSCARDLTLVFNFNQRAVDVVPRPRQRPERTPEQ